jgi:mannosyltransferase OCH1-like enzyme
MTIQKIIHQTWKTRQLSERQKSWTESWRIKNPVFEYKFYNDIDCFKFISNNYPEYLDLYEDLKPVEKADVFRYLILHKYGGIYADIDTECLRPIDSLIDLFNNSLITGYEYNEPVQYLQWFIACPKGHETMIELVKEIKRRNWYKHISNKDPNKLTYWLTGPELYTDVIRKTEESVSILKKGMLGSYDKTLISRRSYLQHYFEGSWKSSNYLKI